MKRPWLFLACVSYSEGAFSAQNPNDFQTELANGQVTITAYRGSAKDVRIPGKINGMPVTSIGVLAFAYTQLKSVTIPESVTSIGASAFAYTQLKSITIPNSVTSIGASAFAYTQLKSITIPNSVVSIGEEVFAACTNLSAITVEADNPSFSSRDGVLFSKDMKTLVAYPGGKSATYKIPDSVTSIGKEAFALTPLTSVTIPDSVTSIGSWAFAYTRLNSVTIPDSVISIGSWAFALTPLTSLIIPNSVTSIGTGTFAYTLLRNLTIPNSVTSIGEDAFDEDVKISREN